jgi:chaperonin cofactor prefoldin
MDSIQSYLSEQQHQEQERIQKQIEEISDFLDSRRSIAEKEKQHIDSRLEELRGELDQLQSVKSKWQTQSRRERKLAIQQSIRDLVERRTELTQEMSGSLEDPFMEKIELERELDEIQSSNAYELL